MTPDHPAWFPTEAPPLYSQDGQGYQATVWAHYFAGNCDWFITEYDPAEGIAFGWACLGGDRQNAELGYVSMEELAAIRLPVVVQLGPDEGAFVRGSQQIERESDWTPAPLEECVARLDARQGAGT